MYPTLQNILLYKISPTLHILGLSLTISVLKYIYFLNYASIIAFTFLTLVENSLVSYFFNMSNLNLNISEYRCESSIPHFLFYIEGPLNKNTLTILTMQTIVRIYNIRVTGFTRCHFRTLK